MGKEGTWCKGAFAEWRGVDRRDGLECLLAVRDGDVLYSIRWGEEEDALGFECLGACELKCCVQFGAMHCAEGGSRLAGWCTDGWWR